MNFENQIVCNYLLSKRNEEISLGIKRLCEGQEFANCIYLGEFLERWTSKISINNENDLISLVYATLCYGSNNDANNDQMQSFISQCMDYLKDNTKINAFGLEEDSKLDKESKSVIYFGLYCIYKKYKLVGIASITKEIENIINTFEKFKLENQILVLFATNLYAEEELETLTPKMYISDNLFSEESNENLSYIKILGKFYKVISEYKIKISSDLKKKLICCRDLSTKEEKNPDKYSFLSSKNAIKFNYKFLTTSILGTSINVGIPATNRIVTRYIQLNKEQGKLYETLNEDYILTFFENTFKNKGKKYISEYKIKFTDFKDLLEFLTKIMDISYRTSYFNNFFKEFLEIDYLYLYEDYDFNNIQMKDINLVMEILKSTLNNSTTFTKKRFDIVFKKLETLYKNKLTNKTPINTMFRFNGKQVSDTISKYNLIDEKTNFIYGYDFKECMITYIKHISKSNIEECLRLMLCLNNKDLSSFLKEEYNLYKSPFYFRDLAKTQNLNKNFYDLYFKFFKLNLLDFAYMQLLLSNINDIYTVYEFTQEEKDLLEIEINTYNKDFNKYNHLYINYLLNNFNRVCELMKYSSKEKLNLKQKLSSFGYDESIKHLYTKEENELIKFNLMKEKITNSSRYNFIKNNLDNIKEYKEENPNKEKELKELIKVFENLILDIATSDDKKSYSFIDIKDYFMLKKSNLLPNIVTEIEKYYEESI